MSFRFSEFSFKRVFDIWERVWSARLIITKHMEEFIALAIFLQFKSAVLDAHLNSSDILSLFNSEYEQHKQNVFRVCNYVDKTTRQLT